MPKLDPQAMSVTIPYGFVVDHDAFWGIPIPGYDPAPQAASNPPTEPAKVPTQLEVSSVSVRGKWTNGQIRILVTRMPPLFHALHHNTLVAAPKEFVPRPRGGDRPEAGERALVGIINLDYNKKGKGTAETTRPVVKMHHLTTGKLKLKDKAKAWKYFDITSQGGFSWDSDLVGPLGALWIVLLNEDGTPAFFDQHLGGGYRLWHHKSHHANRNFFTWTINQSQDRTKIEMEIKIGQSPTGAEWKEQTTVEFTLTWV